MNSTILRTVSSLFLAAGLSACLLSGCSSTPSARPASAGQSSEVDVLQEGDVIQIVFPGATNLNTVAKIPLEGVIKLSFAGDFKAAGKTLNQLQDEILQVFGPQLQVKEVQVTRISTSASVYVSGAVLRPGKIPLERPLTVLEAIMEAGGFEQTRAKLSQVTVIRQEGGKQISFKLDLSKTLKGEPTTPVYLRPSDVVHVPFKTFNL